MLQAGAAPLRPQRGGSLYLQVVAAILVGAALGYWQPAFAVELKPFADLFVKLVKLIIPPVIFLTIVTGITSAAGLGAIGKVALKALAYFTVVSTFALVFGMAAANLLHPGAGMNITAASLHGSAIKGYVSQGHDLTIAGFLTSIVPDSIAGAFVDGNILQILLISVLFGVAFSLAGERARPAVLVMDGLCQAVFRVVDILMRLAPFGALGAMAFTIGKFGLGALLNLLGLVLAIYGTSLAFVIVGLGLICMFSRFSIFGLIAYIKEEILMVLGTSSSESALPSLMEKLEAAGCARSVVGLVVPIGYSICAAPTSTCRSPLCSSPRP